MAKEKPVKGVYSNQKKKYDLDCSVCFPRKEGCQNAQEGKFCGKFKSKEVDPKALGKDPNWLWEHGEDVEFDS